MKGVIYINKYGYSYLLRVMITTVWRALLDPRGLKEARIGGTFEI